MAITEQTRHHLYEYFVDTMGEERAMAMMEHLPVGGAEALATKQDIELLRQAMATKVDMADLRTEFTREIQGLRAELHNVVRVHTIALVTANAAIGAIILTATRGG